jgi:hypothetical protein
MSYLYQKLFSINKVKETTYYSATCYSDNNNIDTNKIRYHFNHDPCYLWIHVYGEGLKYKIIDEYKKTCLWNLIHADLYPDSYFTLKDFMKYVTYFLPYRYLYKSPAMSGYEALVLSIMTYVKLDPSKKFIIIKYTDKNFCDLISQIFNVFYYNNTEVSTIYINCCCKNKCRCLDYYDDLSDDIICGITDNSYFVNNTKYKWHLHIPFGQTFIDKSNICSVTIDCMDITFGGETCIASKDIKWRDNIQYISSKWVAGLYWSYTLGGSVSIHNMACSNVGFKNIDLHKVKQYGYSSKICNTTFNINCRNIPKYLRGNYQFTSCGTESIIKALSILSRNKKFLMCPHSAHVSVFRAAQIFNLEIVELKLTDDYLIDIDDLNNKLELYKNDCVIVVSSPSYPYGINEVDKDFVNTIINLHPCERPPIHVDACLGGLFLTEEESRLINKIYTTISIDSHKYAQTPKGSSLLKIKTPLAKYAESFVIRGSVSSLSIQLALDNLDSPLISRDIKDVIKCANEICYYINNNDLPIKLLGKSTGNRFNLLFKIDKGFSMEKFIESMEKKQIKLSRIQTPSKNMCQRSLLLSHFIITPVHLKNNPDFHNYFISSLLSSIKESEYKWYNIFNINSTSIIYGANISIFGIFNFLSSHLMRKRGSMLLDHPELIIN